MVADIDEPGSGVGMRWPAFLAEAAKADIRAVFVFPVRTGAISLRAIDLYRRSPGPLGREELAMALTAVDAVAVAVLDVAGTLDSGLDIDWVSSMAVHRAAGMVMDQLGTSIDNALVRLRAAAYAEGVPVNELANAVIVGTRRFQEEERADDRHLGRGYAGQGARRQWSSRTRETVSVNLTAHHRWPPPRRDRVEGRLQVDAPGPVAVAGGDH
jgi:hypothetical protein